MSAAPNISKRGLRSSRIEESGEVELHESLRIGKGQHLVREPALKRRLRSPPERNHDHDCYRNAVRNRGWLFRRGAYGPCSVPASAEAAAGPFEAWVRVAVLDASRLGADHPLTIAEAGCDTNATDGLMCSFPRDLQTQLSADHAALGPWHELGGSTLTLRLRAEPTVSATGVDPVGIDTLIASDVRAEARALANMNFYSSQKRLLEPEALGGICVIFDPSDPTWPALDPVIERLDQQVTVLKEAASFDGLAGYLSLSSALTALHKDVADGLIGMVVVVYGGNAPKGVVALQRPDIASLVCHMPVPVIVGLARGPHPSLLHDVAFAATESPAEAMAVVAALARG